MIFREVHINDKQLFNEFEYICSDYVFSYIYMYCELYKLKIYHDDNSVIIHSVADKPCFYMPLGNTELGIKSVIEYCSKNNIKPIFVKIPEEYISLFKEFNFKINEDRDSFDYIFTNSELANYEGKKFRKQRNNLSSYLKLCTPQYTDDIKDHIEECRAFTLANHKNVDVINPTLRILDKLDQFNCRGGIVWDGHEIQAFCVYEKVSHDTILSHVELTDNSHRGIHAYMINRISENIEEEYVNKEDDMGLPGLRRFKETYNPYLMLKKYTAYME